MWVRMKRTVSTLFGGFAGFLREMDRGLAVMRGEEVGIGYRSTDVRETRAAEHVDRKSVV